MLSWIWSALAKNSLWNQKASNMAAPVTSPTCHTPIGQHRVPAWNQEWGVTFLRSQLSSYIHDPQRQRNVSRCEWNWRNGTSRQLNQRVTESTQWTQVQFNSGCRTAYSLWQIQHKHACDKDETCLRGVSERFNQGLNTSSRSQPNFTVALSITLFKTSIDSKNTSIHLTDTLDVGLCVSVTLCSSASRRTPL